MQTFYFTDPGKVRSHNEDSVTIVSNENKEFVLAIADGMGGHKAGEIASSIAIEHIMNSFYSLETGRTMAFVSLGLLELVHCFNIKSEQSIFKARII